MPTNTISVPYGTANTTPYFEGSRSQATPG